MPKEIPVTGPPKRVPTHPGALLRNTILPELGLSISAAARHLKVSRMALSNLLSERSELSPDMAARLEKAFGLDMGLLLRMQLAHTEAIKRQHWDEIDVERFALG